MARKKKTTGDGPVYSSKHGRMCPACAKPVAECACEPEGEPPAPGGTVIVGRETKGRKGRGVTVVTGVPLPPSELKVLAKRLKRRCGSGGTVREGRIEIQGDHRNTLVAALEKEGYPVKRSG